MDDLLDNPLLNELEKNTIRSYRLQGNSVQTECLRSIDTAYLEYICDIERAKQWPLIT